MKMKKAIILFLIIGIFLINGCGDEEEHTVKTLKECYNVPKIKYEYFNSSETLTKYLADGKPVDDIFAWFDYKNRLVVVDFKDDKILYDIVSENAELIKYQVRIEDYEYRCFEYEEDSVIPIND